MVEAAKVAKKAASKKAREIKEKARLANRGQRKHNEKRNQTNANKPVAARIKKQKEHTKQVDNDQAPWITGDGTEEDALKAGSAYPVQGLPQLRSSPRPLAHPLRQNRLRRCACGRFKAKSQSSPSSACPDCSHCTNRRPAPHDYPHAGNFFRVKRPSAQRRHRVMRPRPRKLCCPLLLVMNISESTNLPFVFNSTLYFFANVHFKLKSL
jgi:hypothetical protein